MAGLRFSLRQMLLYMYIGGVGEGKVKIIAQSSEYKLYMTSEFLLNPKIINVTHLLMNEDRIHAGHFLDGTRCGGLRQHSPSTAMVLRRFLNWKKGLVLQMCLIFKSQLNCVILKRNSYWCTYVFNALSPQQISPIWVHYDNFNYLVSIWFFTFLFNKNE